MDLWVEQQTLVAPARLPAGQPKWKQPHRSGGGSAQHREQWERAHRPERAGDHRSLLAAQWGLHLCPAWLHIHGLSGRVLPTAPGTSTLQFLTDQEWPPWAGRAEQSQRVFASHGNNAHLGTIHEAEKFKSQAAAGNQWAGFTRGGASGASNAPVYSH